MKKCPLLLTITMLLTLAGLPAQTNAIDFTILKGLTNPLSTLIKSIDLKKAAFFAAATGAISTYFYAMNLRKIKQRKKVISKINTALSEADTTQATIKLEFNDKNESNISTVAWKIIQENNQTFISPDDVTGMSYSRSNINLSINPRGGISKEFFAHFDAINRCTTVTIEDPRNNSKLSILNDATNKQMERMPSSRN